MRVQTKIMIILLVKEKRPQIDSSSSMVNLILEFYFSCCDNDMRLNTHKKLLYFATK